MAIVTPKSTAAWTRNSLKHRSSAMRKQAWLCRKAYTRGPYKDACEYLADAYDKAAQVFDDALAGVVERTPTEETEG